MKLNCRFLSPLLISGSYFNVNLNPKKKKNFFDFRSLFGKLKFEYFVLLLLCNRRGAYSNEQGFQQQKTARRNWINLFKSKNCTSKTAAAN